MKTYKDFLVGETFTSAGCTVTESHLVAFAGLSGDFHPLHTDEAYCRTTEFGQRVAHGPLIYSLALGLVSQRNVFGEAVVALLGADHVRHLAPCFIGTTITVEVTILESRPTKNHRQGVVTARYSARDDRANLVMEAELAFLTHAPTDRTDHASHSAAV